MALKRKSGETEQDFEINIASIIDCFTVLITYLLVAASFVSIGFFDVGIVTEGAVEDTEQLPPVNLDIVMKPQGEFRLLITGAASKVVNIPGSAEGTWDYTALGEELLNLKNRWSMLNGATIGAADGIKYEDVVKTVEVSRNLLPQVFLGND